MDGDTTLGQERAGKESIAAVAAWAGQDEHRAGAGGQHRGGSFRHRCGGKFHELIRLRLLG